MFVRGASSDHTEDRYFLKELSTPVFNSDVCISNVCKLFYQAAKQTRKKAEEQYVTSVRSYPQYLSSCLSQARAHFFSLSEKERHQRESYPTVQGQQGTFSLSVRQWPRTGHTRILYKWVRLFVINTPD
jgi:hypothetical protein